MADGFTLFDDGNMGLLACVDLCSVAALFQKMTGQIEIARVACRAIEFAEGEFDFLMAGNRLKLRRARAERAFDQIRATDGDVQQLALSRDVIVGDGGLVHMADVVQLMAGRAVAPAGGAHHAVVRLAVLRTVVETCRTGRVEIAVGLLRGGDDVDQFV